MTRLRILLVAPNVSRRMGGEALKALQICEGLVKRGHIVRQITHARVRAELECDWPQLDIVYIDDDCLQASLASAGFQFVLSTLNAWQLARAARAEIARFMPDVIHATAPISPVLPVFAMNHPHVIVGPLNGNLRYPAAFRRREPLLRALAARLTPLTNFALRGVNRQKRAATLLVAGGTRTRRALAAGGMSDAQMIDTHDSGVAASLFAVARSPQTDRNGRFVFAGRLVNYKGCDLVIEALRTAAPDITLDILGDGPERARLESLVEHYALASRVRFEGWQLPDHCYYERLQSYRALVLPTLAEANGIVFQEAMALGLAIVAVDWGGAANLLDASTALLIPPTGEADVVRALSTALETLADDHACAEQLARAARVRAHTAGFAWPELLATWEMVYQRRMPIDVAAPRRASQ